MSLLVSNLQTNVINKIGLSSSAEGSLVLTWLTEGYRDLLQRTRFFVSSTDIDLISGTDEYQIDTTIEQIEDATILGSLVKPDFVTREEILDLRRYANSGTTQGDVYCYNIDGNLLMIYPNPTADSTMHIYYIAQWTLSDFAGTEDLVADLNCVPVGPIAKALEYYALWQASEYDDKQVTDNSTQYLQMYETFVVQVKKAVMKRSHRQPPMARVGYPVKRGFPRRNDVYPALSRQES